MDEYWPPRDVSPTTLPVARVAPGPLPPPPRHAASSAVATPIAVGAAPAAVGAVPVAAGADAGVSAVSAGVSAVSAGVSAVSAGTSAVGAAETIEARLRVIFSETLQVDVPTPDIDLVDSGLLDSLGFVKLIVALEDTFGRAIVVEELELERFRSIAAIADFIRGS